MFRAVRFVLPHEGFDGTSDGPLGECLGGSTAVGDLLSTRGG